MNVRELVAQALEQHGAITHEDDVGAQHLVETLSAALAKVQPIINININVPIPDAREGTETILAVLTDISKRVAAVATTEGTILMNVDDVIAKANATLAGVQANTSLDQSIAKLVDDNTAQIASLQAALAAAGTDPAKLQQLSDVMDAIQAAETANGQIVAAKVVANTSAATPATGA